MKKVVLILLILSFVCTFSINVSAEGYSDDFRDSVELEDSLLSNDTDLNDPGSIMKDLEFKNIFSYIWRRLSDAFKSAVDILARGVALVLFSVLVSRCCGNIQNQNLQLLFSFIVSLSIALMCERSIHECAVSLQKSIEDMLVFSSACIPAFSVVMISAGEGASAAVFSASLVFLGETGALIANNVLMPLTDVFMAIGICSAVSDEYNFASIGKNIRRFVVWLIGILIVLFRFIIRMQNATASAGNHITQKYIRTALGSLIPMVGNTLSEGIDGIFAIASGVKTSFAIGGILIVLSIMLPTFLSIAVHALCWNGCKWFAEFMNDITVRSIAGVMADCYYLMLALGGCITLMGLFSFFGIITQVA